MAVLFKKPSFIIPFCFLLLLLLASFLFEPILGDKQLEVTAKYDENRELIGSAPFNTVEHPPLGTDRFGMPIHLKIIQGAKYTLIPCFLISFITVLSAFAISIIYVHFLKKIHWLVEGLINSMYFVPASIISFILLVPLQSYLDPTDSPYLFISIQMSVITLVSIPPLVILFAKDINEVLKEEYVLASKTIGASGLFLYRKHVIPHLFKKIILQFNQKTVELLILITHLGFLNIYLGGYVMREVFFEEFRPFSLTNEWAGEIGRGYVDLVTTPWIILSIVVMLSLVILSLNFISKSIEEVFDVRHYSHKRRLIKKNKSVASTSPMHLVDMQKEKFTFVNQKGIDSSL